MNNEEFVKILQVVIVMIVIMGAIINLKTSAINDRLGSLIAPPVTKSCPALKVTIGIIATILGTSMIYESCEAHPSSHPIQPAYSIETSQISTKETHPIFWITVIFLLSMCGILCIIRRRNENEPEEAKNELDEPLVRDNTSGIIDTRADDGNTDSEGCKTSDEIPTVARNSRSHESSHPHESARTGSSGDTGELGTRPVTADTANNNGASSSSGDIGNIPERSNTTNAEVSASSASGANPANNHGVYLTEGNSFIDSMLVSVGPISRKGREGSIAQTEAKFIHIPTGETDESWEQVPIDSDEFKIYPEKPEMNNQEKLIVKKLRAVTPPAIDLNAADPFTSTGTIFRVQTTVLKKCEPITRITRLSDRSTSTEREFASGEMHLMDLRISPVGRNPQEWQQLFDMPREWIVTKQRSLAVTNSAFETLMRSPRGWQTFLSQMLRQHDILPSPTGSRSYRLR